MDNARDYLLSIRKRVGQHTKIFVPRTPQYEKLLASIRDENIYFKGEAFEIDFIIQQACDKTGPLWDAIKNNK